MPDLDRIERKLHPAWLAAYRLIKGGQPLEEIARALLQGLARVLREEGGVPGLPEFVHALQEHDAGRLDDRRFDAVVTNIERRMEESGSGKLLARATLRPAVSSFKALLQGPPAERLLQTFLKLKVESELFARQRDYLIGKRFSSRSEEVAFETRLLGSIQPQLEVLAKRLSSDLKAERLKAPSRRRKRKKTTEELIDEPLF
jgi:hypothetical protein